MLDTFILIKTKILVAKPHYYQKTKTLVIHDRSCIL